MFKKVSLAIAAMYLVWGATAHASKREHKAISTDCYEDSIGNYECTVSLGSLKLEWLYIYASGGGHWYVQAVPLQDPAFSGGTSVGGGTQTCNYPANLTAAQFQKIGSDPCLDEAYYKPSCYVFGGKPTQAFLYIDNIWQPDGQYCPNTHGGSDLVTVCPGGTEVFGSSPCLGSI